MKALTAKQEAFAQAVADVANPKSLSDAYRLAYDASKMTGVSVQRCAAELAANPAVASRINELKQAQVSEFVFKQIDVLREWMTIATADPSELTATRVLCCRHCYGFGHAYQWRDELEYARACDEVIEWNEMRRSGKAQRELPDFSGGDGYDHTKPPVDACPNCKGAGELVVRIADTSTLSPAARKLFAGVKQTKDGVQILMRDQDGALANIARYLGMFVEKREISGPNGGPIPSANVSLVADIPLDEASKLYAAAMG